MGGTTQGRTAWSFGRGRSSVLLLRVHVTSVGGDLRHILAGFAHVCLALMRALTFASIFSPIEGFATLLALLEAHTFGGAHGMFRGIGSLPVGRKHPMVLVTMWPVKATSTVRTGDLRRSGGFAIARKNSQVLAAVFLLVDNAASCHARMMLKILVVVPLVAHVTIVTASENGGEGFQLVIVVVIF